MPDLTPPAAGLRDLHYDGKSSFKGQVNVHPDDKLTVPDHVADQLQEQSSQFKTVTPKKATKTKTAAKRAGR